MSPTVPQAVQLCHELLLWLIPQLDKFPRSRRFTLGERLEDGVLEVLELLVEAVYQRNKETPFPPLRPTCRAPPPSSPRVLWPRSSGPGS